jgi:hypothetical protein
VAGMNRRKPNLSPIGASHAYTEILRLETELYIARDTVIKLVAPACRGVLVHVAYTLAPSEFNLGVSDAAEAIAALAKPLPPRAIGGVTDPSERGLCPLCGAGSAQTWNQLPGFALPGGLLRHLEGTGRVQPCPVFSIAVAMGRERGRK